MKIVGLTGGIGSGKTTVANMFADLGVPIYIADLEAKKLMRNSKVIKRKLIILFGDKAYVKGALNKPFIANAIFNDKALLDKMNAIIHPKVGKHFKKWMLKQNGPYIIKEAAIIFENGTEDHFDYIITVTVSKTERIKRILKRDDTTLDRINAIIKNQWSDKEKIKRSDFIITNDTLKDTLKQVNKIHNKLLQC